MPNLRCTLSAVTIYNDAKMLNCSVQWRWQNCHICFFGIHVICILTVGCSNCLMRRWWRAMVEAMLVLKTLADSMAL